MLPLHIIIIVIRKKGYERSSVTNFHGKIATFGMRSDWSGLIPNGPRITSTLASRVVYKDYYFVLSAGVPETLSLCLAFDHVPLL